MWPWPSRPVTARSAVSPADHRAPSWSPDLLLTGAASTRTIERNEGGWSLRLEESSQRAVSRILSAFARLTASYGATIIPLAPPLLTGSSGLPGSFRLRFQLRRNSPKPWRRRSDGPSSIASLFGLAPCGVLPATDVATGAVRSYRTFSPLPTFARSAGYGGQAHDQFLDLRPASTKLAKRAKSGGIFSVPLSFELPRPGVTRRTALRSSDFPPFDSPLRGSLRASPRIVIVSTLSPAENEFRGPVLSEP